MMAIGEPTAGGDVPAFRVLVRDTSGAAAVSAALTREEAVIGIVGVGDAVAVQQTSRDGVPFLVLGDQPPGAQTTAFQLLHAAETRAVALARRALAAGAKQFAILGPDTASAKRLADAFRRAVEGGQGRVVIHKTYVAGVTSFSAPVAELSRHRFDALFVPDAADRLELIAPALGVAGIWSRGVAGAAPRALTPGRREILLLSTAVNLSRNLLRNAGKFVQGALLAPGYFAAEDDPLSSGFVTRFRALYGQDPSATDAYSYDGVRALRAAVERGARTRADVTRVLATDAFQGVTGGLRFGPDHARIDPPLLYVVEGDAIRPLR
jgi:branched-chain amino acid transport system substrate-binding protein